MQRAEIVARKSQSSDPRRYIRRACQLYPVRLIPLDLSAWLAICAGATRRFDMAHREAAVALTPLITSIKNVPAAVKRVGHSWDNQMYNLL